MTVFGKINLIISIYKQGPQDPAAQKMSRGLKVKPRFISLVPHFLFLS